MEKNVAILWDIENVLPRSGQSNILVDGLISYTETIGNKSYMIAVGDWINCPKNLPEILSEKGFELIYIPRNDENGKRTKNSVDFVLVLKATEMIFQYPHIDTYIILTGDVDFRPLLQLLKKHGKNINIIYNPNTISERLLEFADDYKSYMDLMPDETEKSEIIEYDEKKHNFSEEQALNLLTAAIEQMEEKGKVPTPGSVKVRMKMINDNFNGSVIGYKNWIDFISAAKLKKRISIKEKSNDMILSATNVANPSKDIFDKLQTVMYKINKDKVWISFTKINQRMIDEKINIKNYQYTKFKKMALEAESRGIIEIKNEGLKWSAKLK